jgi:hypothetical protein
VGIVDPALLARGLLQKYVYAEKSAKRKQRTGRIWRNCDIWPIPSMAKRGYWDDACNLTIRGISPLNGASVLYNTFFQHL